MSTLEDELAALISEIGADVKSLQSAVVVPSVFPSVRATQNGPLNFGSSVVITVPADVVASDYVVVGLSAPGNVVPSISGFTLMIDSTAGSGFYGNALLVYYRTGLVGGDTFTIVGAAGATYCDPYSIMYIKDAVGGPSNVSSAGTGFAIPGRTITLGSAKRAFTVVADTRDSATATMPGGWHLIDTVVQGAGGVAQSVYLGDSASGEADTMSSTGTAFATSVSFIMTGTPGVDIGDAFWTPVASFSNSWVNYGGSEEPAAYQLDDSKEVHLRGTIKSGSANSKVFTLPLGYRPSSVLHIPCISYNGTTVGFAECVIGINGDVGIYNALGNTYVRIDGISFPVV